MKFKKLFLIFLLLLVFTPLHVSNAQYTTPGCYTTTNGILVRLGNTSADGTCPQGSRIGDGGTAGVTVPNNLSYTPLEPIPGQAGAPVDFCSLLNLLFKVLIYLGGMLAVLFLVLGGITYMVSEVVDKRSVARDRIKAAVIGLLILLGAYLILFTVNPNLVNACHVLAPTSTGVYYQPPPPALDAARAACQSTQGTIKTGTMVTVALTPWESSFWSNEWFPESPITCSGLEWRGWKNALTGYKRCEPIQPGEVCLYY